MGLFAKRNPYLAALFLVMGFFDVHNSLNHPLSDDFFHIQTVLIPYVNGDLTLSDFFILRGTTCRHIFL